jgi:hypothetical protein
MHFYIIKQSEKPEKLEKQDHSETKPSMSHKPIELRNKSSKKSLPQSSVTDLLHPKDSMKVFSPY